jgi:hypothetical protein
VANVWNAMELLAFCPTEIAELFAKKVRYLIIIIFIITIIIITIINININFITIIIINIITIIQS